MALTHLAHQLIRAHFQDQPKTLAVDATLGNGHDAVFLIQLGFKNVLGFDVQTHAIETSRARIQEAAHTSQRSQLVLASHAELAQHVTERVDCFMFNFGYLPRSDKTITTTAETSLKAIKAALRLLNIKGIMTLLCYPGHTAGRLETQAIQAYLSAIKDWQIDTHRSQTPTPTSPILYCLRNTQTSIARD